MREGRERMRATFLSWLPDDLSGRRLLDAGCGTGALAVAAARRGAEVVAVDLSPTLVGIGAGARCGAAPTGRIAWVVGDMLDPALGSFDHVVAMDSLIHYRARDVVRALAGLAARTRISVLFTFAPRTVLLAAMHAVGRAFPKSDRAPSIEPVSERALRRLIATEPALAEVAIGRTERIQRGFYTSQAMELARR
ncbi:MAG: magnesium protoporphyrin IX methyltransferase [Acetobacteraceae bacterium]|nr:magnesium protoporphyrin IX methyltransferase [Acetobacteraceae bacterium]